MTPTPAPRARWIALLLCGVLLTGCSMFGKKKPEGPARLDLVLQPAADLNPDATGRASPLVVRVYALRSLDTFAKADFFALYDNDEQVLAADLVKREELILKPGEKQTLPREYATEVQHVAVLAAYRDVAHAIWRASTAVTPGFSGTLTLDAGAKGIAVSLQPTKD